MLFANLTDNAKITEMYNKSSSNDMKNYFILLLDVTTNQHQTIPDRSEKRSIRHVIIKFYISF